MIDLEKLMKLHDAATPGPWKVTDKCAHLYVTDSNPNREIARIGWKPKAYVENASYIAAACNAVPELVARIRELEDAAGFEARVAKKLETGMCVECEEFNKKPTCPISIY